MVRSRSSLDIVGAKLGTLSRRGAFGHGSLIVGDSVLSFFRVEPQFRKLACGQVADGLAQRSNKRFLHLIITKWIIPKATTDPKNLGSEEELFNVFCPYPIVILWTLRDTTSHHRELHGKPSRAK